MCGIAGIYSNNHSENLSVHVKRMTDAIAHRGPDGEGHWHNEQQTIALGHRRLSIIDVSEQANQPFHYQDRYAIVFNGEIYNYLELKEELIQDGFHFSTTSDTEVLIALFSKHKEKCLEMLDGMFAFAIWDKQENVLFCARDRFGEKPFHFCHHNGNFYFASEMKAFWTLGIPKIPNKERIFSYLAYDKLQDPIHSTTFFQGIHQLEPAHYFYLKNGQIIDKTCYWKIDPSIQNKEISFEDAQEKFFALFEESIKKRLRSDVPIGSSLSGGLDSSSIVMMIDRLKQENQSQKTFSARFEGFARDEGQYIDQIVEASNTEAFAIYCTPENLNENIQQVIYHQEEPFGSKSILAQWNVMKLAKEQNVTVLLDGQGADEYLAGYTPFFMNYIGELRRVNKKSFENAKNTYKKLYSQELDLGEFFAVHVFFPNLRDKIRSIKNRIQKPRYLAQFNPEFLATNESEYRTGYVPNLNAALYKATFSEGLQTLLRYADRNSMAHSREVRLPFLSHELVTFVFSLPSEYKIHEFWTKAILRYSMNDLLPGEICWRKEKVGFEPPFSREISEKELLEAVDFLEKKNILAPGKFIKEKAWEYVQVKQLYS